MLNIGQGTSPVWPVFSITRTGRKDWTMEKIAIGDGVYYANYKAPFQQLEGATPGYPLGELPYDVDGRLLCPYADRHQERRQYRTDRPHKDRVVRARPMTYHNLGAHLAKTHGMSADQFKDEAGLNQGTALVSERTRLLNSAHGQRLRAQGKFHNHTFTVAAAIKGGLKGGRGQKTPQSLNKRNVCYSQVLVTARQVLANNGRLTETLMRKAGVAERIVAMHFGSWQEFMRRFDQRTSGSGYRLTDADLIHDLQSVASILGHTPTVSDMRRYQMASRHAYEDHFGSWTGACERAGVQPNVPAMWLTRPFSTEEDAAILGAYAMTGSYTKAAARHGISAQRARDILLRFGLAPINGNNGTHMQRQEQMARAAELTRRLLNVA